LLNDSDKENKMKKMTSEKEKTSFTS